MKKLISLILLCILACGCLCVNTLGEEFDTVTINVTISDKGNLVVALDEITVTDIDGDGALTINDALYCAHEENYEGGASAGYGFAESEYGLSITKLWGDTSGSYGYYVNNASAWSLLDNIKDGDNVSAFVYADAVAWSDSYSFFNVNVVEAVAGEAIELTLSAAGYDESWNPITVPVEGAVITIDGVATEFVTDAQGKVNVVIENSGEFVISATSDSLTIVPPVCVATINPKEIHEVTSEEPSEESSESTSEATPDSTPETGDRSDDIAVFAVIALAIIGMVSMRKRTNEK